MFNMRIGQAEGEDRLAMERRRKLRRQRKSAVRFASTRCAGLRSLVFPVFGSTGYSVRDVDAVLSACRRVSSLFFFARGRRDHHPNSCRHIFAPLSSLLAAGRFRNIVLLTVQLRVTDADTQAIAGHLPSLRALHIIKPACVYDRQQPLTSLGVAALINGLPSLTVLYLDGCFSLTAPVPACRSGVRMLGLIGDSMTNHLLQSLLSHIGQDLLTLSLHPRYGGRISFLTDEAVQYIADLCPNLQNLKPACASLLLAFLLSPKWPACVMSSLIIHSTITQTWSGFANTIPPLNSACSAHGGLAK